MDTQELRQRVLDWIEADREKLIAFLQGFIRAKSPNPPGDCREAADYIRRFLDSQNLPYRVLSPHPEMPNIVGSFEGGAAGRHLVLNGHIDVFPVNEADDRWTVEPWSGERRDGRIYGRGACDMKPGTTASIFTYAYLHRLREHLKGKLTLTCVSDEETFGPWGARWLIDNEPEVLGDCVLNGEPGSPLTIRFGEKGPLWIAFTIRTKGAHGAYTHATESATKTAFRLATDLERICELEIRLPDNIARAVDAAREAVDAAMGKGAGDTVPRVTLNIGRIDGGLKVNMIPGECRMEADFRLPVGAVKEDVLGRVREVLKGYPDVAMEEIGGAAPSYCDPYGEMVEILRNTVQDLKGFRPTPIVSLGGTDARLWRYKNIPAYVYGPYPTGMGSYDEQVEIEEFIHIVRTHVLASLAYLMRD